MAEDQCGSRPYRVAIPIRVDGSYISLRRTLHEERAEPERGNGAQWSASLWKFGMLKRCQFSHCAHTLSLRYQFGGALTSCATSKRGVRRTRRLVRASLLTSRGDACATSLVGHRKRATIALCVRCTGRREMRRMWFSNVLVRVGPDTPPGQQCNRHVETWLANLRAWEMCTSFALELQF